MKPIAKGQPSVSVRTAGSLLRPGGYLRVGDGLLLLYAGTSRQGEGRRGFGGHFWSFGRSLCTRTLLSRKGQLAEGLGRLCSFIAIAA